MVAIARGKLRPYQVVFDVEGATADDLAYGLEAAQAVFIEAGIEAWEGAMPFHVMNWGAAGQPLSADEILNGLTYSLAIEAALRAACRNLSSVPKRYRFYVEVAGDPPVIVGPNTIYPKTVRGVPHDDAILVGTEPRRKLECGYWDWD